jgi:hypothetical protein
MTYKLHEKEEEGITLCPDSYCPQNNINFRLSVLGAAQHDGKSWSMEYVKECEDALVDRIVDDLRAKVKAFVRKTAPYNCHHFPEDH